jgi:hypothetical protein
VWVAEGRGGWQVNSARFIEPNKGRQEQLLRASLLPSRRGFARAWGAEAARARGQQMGPAIKGTRALLI